MASLLLEPLGCREDSPPNAVRAPVPSRASSGLPPTARAGVPKPRGNAAHLKVLDWAGFTSAATFTFDDSQPSQIDAWPTLKAEGVRMTFYVNASARWYAGYDETWKEASAAGSEIGNHTYHHCRADLTECTSSFSSAALEIDSDTSYIENTIGASRVQTMAYPYGDGTYAPLAKERFFLARGVRPGMVAANDDTDPFDLPTIGAHGGEAASAFNASTDAARSNARWVIFLFHSLLPTSYAWYASVNLTSVTGAIAYAKSLRDVWIDSVVNVGAYWLGQRILSNAQPSASDARETWTWSLPAHFPAGKTLHVTVEGGTLSQNGTPLLWSDHGYYEVALDAGSLTWSR
jgi:peptidoglycan/xylan/chitin deacetylase (PgdA/CDA1 family)